MKHIVLVAHGSRSAAWAKPFVKLTEAITEAADYPVTLAFMEINEPKMVDVVKTAAGQDGMQEVHVVPLFMSSGGHVDRDIRTAIDALRAECNATLICHPAIGEHEAVFSAMVQSAALKL